MSFSSTPWLHPMSESAGISYMQFCFVQIHAERNLIVSMDLSRLLSPSAQDAWMISYADSGLLMFPCLYIHRPHIGVYTHMVYVFILAPANVYKKVPLTKSTRNISFRSCHVLTKREKISHLCE
jgi:hypothetical protein